MQEGELKTYQQNKIIEKIQKNQQQIKTQEKKLEDPNDQQNMKDLDQQQKKYELQQDQQKEESIKLMEEIKKDIQNKLDDNLDTQLKQKNKENEKNQQNSEDSESDYEQSDKYNLKNLKEIGFNLHQWITPEQFKKLEDLSQEIDGFQNLLQSITNRQYNWEQRRNCKVQQFDLAFINKNYYNLQSYAA
ncbi:hypothetical protein PPERSA_02896 [Pseudocohnilembus persalinus]|uniref:Uncharacterized protein n=1 Tax=Pseudocohnilembus persalinus TaxID=266149 RepID=A0A0V0QMR4_PSEPJ|nr:hypothetical protein PPERSA_02896 [Pseudocohnilembus persalinus]|eukprot:KRX03517.1 hypothetical protein PPERSA_02896 [Pseudocohnilembus persalinus]